MREQGFRLSACSGGSSRKRVKIFFVSCLYCVNQPNSIEHPLPAAFGEFKHAPLLENRLCDLCNNQRLGVLDEQLARCGPEAVLRRFFGVQGRSAHDKINPHYRGSAGGRRLEMRGYDKTLGIELELETDKGQVRQLRQLVALDVTGKSHPIPITDEMRNNPEKLRTAYLALNLNQPAHGYVIGDPEELIWMEPLIKAAFPSVSFGPHGTCDENYQGAAVQMELNDRYFRAIAKIGFHYFLTQYDMFTGHESRFAGIRRFIGEGGSIEQINSFVAMRENPLLAPMMDGARPDGWIAHAVCAELGEDCLAHVQLFICQDYRAPVYTVRLGANNNLAVISSPCGHLYRYFQSGPQGRFTGEAHLIVPTRAAVAKPLKPAVTP